MLRLKSNLLDLSCVRVLKYPHLVKFRSTVGHVANTKYLSESHKALGMFSSPMQCGLTLWQRLHLNISTQTANIVKVTARSSNHIVLPMIKIGTASSRSKFKTEDLFAFLSSFKRLMCLDFIRPLK
ncbi:hypothetical protein PoB_001037400 [Plakobranchus ocellatus]|uniref:Uncharacterized protein n=1 Tax=Plakobranchus ocellatus TaxID=259542 RepID=A0AAV3YP18_9GAST|nr:hypothetical protein PoB_001037400 [Plakobranchus ocellatus]